MKYPNPTKISLDYSILVAQIREAEQSRNYEDAISAFQNIWDNFDIDPDFSEFDLNQKAELFRLSGYFLSYYGKHYNLVNYQERGKNLLTKAIEIYSGFGDFENVAEAQNALALCYYYEGAILEAEAILEQTAHDFLGDKLHLIYLQNRGNLLLTKIFQKKYEESLKIIEEIIVPMEFCKDKKACSVFHEKAGRVFRGVKQYKRAILHYQRAIQYAEEINNLVFVSSGKNNLAFLYYQIGKFDLAHFYSDEAIKIAQGNNQFGWLPHFWDTKAAIYFDEGNFNSALDTINQAISIFQKGEDAAGLTEALWNKCKFLLYLDRKQEAIKLFAKLAPLASERMGDFAVDNFSKEFSEIIHVKQNGSLEEETRRFRRSEIISAIRKAKYELNNAADRLRINLTYLTKILDEEFPELYEEINIERFATKIDNKTKSVQNYCNKISQLHLTDTLSNIQTGFSTYYFSPEIMVEIFGISEDLVLAIVPIKEINPNEFTLFYHKAKGIYSFGKVHYDNTFDLYFLMEKNEPMPFSLDDVSLIGKAIGYLPFKEIDNDFLEFKSLNF